MPILVDNIGQTNTSDAAYKSETANLLLHPPDLGTGFDICCNGSKYGAFENIDDCQSALTRFFAGSWSITFAERHIPFIKDWMYSLPWRWMASFLASMLIHPEEATRYFQPVFEASDSRCQHEPGHPSTCRKTCDDKICFRRAPRRHYLESWWEPKGLLVQQNNPADIAKETIMTLRSCSAGLSPSARVSNAMAEKRL